LVVDPHTSESFINLILEVPGCVKRLCYRMGLAEYPPAPLYVGKFRVVKSVIAKVEQCNPPSVRGRIRT